jgi:hypothetical protein
MPEWLLLLAGIVVVALWFLSVYTALRVGMWIVLSSPLNRAFHRGIGRGANFLTRLGERRR